MVVDFQVTTFSLHQFSPLLWYMAMYCESVDVVAYLVDHGADVNIRDEEGVCELHYTTTNSGCFALFFFCVCLSYVVYQA